MKAWNTGSGLGPIPAATAAAAAAARPQGRHRVPAPAPRGKLGNPGGVGPFRTPSERPRQSRRPPTRSLTQ
eukprot:574769-Hanusia_phi.AAC.1